MPLTPGITGSITDGGQIPKTEIEITPLYDDEDSKDTMHDEEGEIVIDPLYMKQRRVAELPPLHKKDAEMRIRTIKAKALDEMREKRKSEEKEGREVEATRCVMVSLLAERGQGRQTRLNTPCLQIRPLSNPSLPSLTFFSLSLLLLNKQICLVVARVARVWYVPSYTSSCAVV